MWCFYRSGESVCYSVSYNFARKIKYYGVRGITNTWFNSFLQDRYQYTNIKECSSEKLLITRGVP